MIRLCQQFLACRSLADLHGSSEWPGVFFVEVDSEGGQDRRQEVGNGDRVFHVRGTV